MLELVASVLIALEKVKAGTGGRKQYGVSFLRESTTYLYGILHGVNLYDGRNDALENLYNLLVINT